MFIWKLINLFIFKEISSLKVLIDYETLLEAFSFIFNLRIFLFLKYFLLFQGSPTMKNLHIDYSKLKDIIRSADDRRGDKMKYLLNKVDY